jgi:hypothetical protein
MIAVERLIDSTLKCPLAVTVTVTVAGPAHSSEARGWAARVHDESRSCQAASGTRAPVIYRSETQGKLEWKMP